MTADQGVYWVMLALAATPEAAQAAARQHAGDGSNEPPTVMATRARVGDEQHLLAARYGVDAAGVTKLGQALQGVEDKRVSTETAVLINNDRAYRKAWAIRPAAQSSAPAKSLVLRAPGEVFAIDGVPFSQPSLVKKRTYVFQGACAVTGFAYGAGGKSHTTQDWCAFGEAVRLAEAAKKHKILLIKVDAASELGRDEEARRALSKAFEAQVVPAAGDDHEWVTAIEGQTSSLKRMTAIAMYRAKALGCPAAAELECYLYQIVVLNDRPKASVKESRVQQHVGVPLNVEHRPRWLFW